MSPHVKIAGTLLATGVLALVGYRLLEPALDDARQQGASDARDTRGRLTVGMDSWIGYLPLCSDAMRQSLRRDGWLIACENDDADYAGRLRRLRRGELQLATATVDSFLLNGADQGFPGVIVAVLDESRGGDAILAWKDRAAGLDALRQLGTAPRIALTPRSPSEHLLNAVASHFDIPVLRDPGARIATPGSEAALALLLERRADLAVLWEPDVNRALRHPGIVKLMGTEDTDGLIVDVLVAGRAFAADHPDVLELLLRHYFRVLRQLRDDPDALARQAAESAGLERAQTPVVLAGVQWQGLTDNALGWFGLGAPAVRAEEGLIDAIEGAAAILRDSGVGTRLIPDDDPYRLIASRFVAALYEGSASPPATPGGARTSGTVEHAPLSERQWARLREVGTLKVRPVLFQSGTASLARRGKEQLDVAAKSLAHYPRFRLRIKGHTGTRGDPAQNRRLSAERAEAVARYLAVIHGVAWARMQPLGRGAEEPLVRRPGESERAYQDRLRRVELVLVAGED